MNTATRPYLFPLVDQHSHGVLAFAPTVSVANAAAQGMINSSPMSVWYPVTAAGARPDRGYNLGGPSLVLVFNQALGGGGGFVASDCNVARAEYDKLSTRPWDFKAMSADATTAEWIAQRALAADRIAALDLLERRCEKYLARTQHFVGDPVFLAYLGPELAQCDPSSEQYTGLVKDWAQINGVSNRAAYDELTMQWHSAGIATVHIHALWSKYLRLINQQTDRLAMEQLVKVQFEGEIRFGKAA